MDDMYRIRVASTEDAEEILAIYAPYVLKTAITFEYEVPTVEEFKQRIANTLKKYPYIVAIHEDRIAGYAYVGSFHSRKAYEWSVETSVYVDESLRKGGLGKKLYKALEAAMKLMGVKNMNACIASPITPDDTLTFDSVHFHEHMGYRMVGEFNSCGCKFGRWYNMCWMEKHLSEHENDPQEVKKFPEIRVEFERMIGMQK